MDRGAWRATVHGITESWFLTQGSHPGLPALQVDSLLSEPPRKPSMNA